MIVWLVIFESRVSDERCFEWEYFTMESPDLGLLNVIFCIGIHCDFDFHVRFHVGLGRTVLS